MPPISKKFYRQPIGRQITRKLNDTSETGVVRELYSASALPEWLTIFTVRWHQPDSEHHYEEHLALSTVTSYYGPDDTYVDEPYVDDEIRLLQRFDWNERKCPKKGTEDFNDEFRKQFGNEGQAARKATKQKTSGAKESATAAAKGASQAADAIADMGTQAKKAAKEAAPSKLARITAPFRHLAAGAAGKVNDAAEHLTKDVPQTLGHVISDALPSSSRKQSSGKPAASTATNSSAQPVGKSAAQVAQDAIIAMSPGRSSGVGKRAASSKKQEEPPSKRTSRHSAAAARPSAVVVDDNDDDVDIGGDDLPEKQDASSSGLVGSIAKIVNTLSGAPSSLAQTSEPPGGSFEATALQEEQGDDGAASPMEPEEHKAYVKLPSGAHPPQVPARLCMSPNDVVVKEYTAADYDAGDGEYVVERIVAEKKINKRIWYLVKWKGYELQTDKWEPRNNLAACEALDAWEETQKGTKAPSKSPAAAAAAAQKGKKKKSGRVH